MSRIVVIGGGHNGLCCAAYLARAGRQVTVLEARESFGGVAGNDEFHPGYTAPGLLHDAQTLAPSVVRELDLVRHGLALNSAPPLYLPAQGSNGLVLHLDPDATATELASDSPGDAKAYAEYREFIKRISPFFARLLGREPPDPTADNVGQLFGLIGMGMALRRLGKKDMREVMRILPMPVADVLDEWFENPLLKAALALPAVQTTFAGPRSPGTAANLVFHECALGAAPVGGPAALVSALVGACESLGVTLRTGATVAGIDEKVVHLASGEKVAADILVSSVDPRRTVLGLLPPTRVQPSLAEEMRRYRMRGNVAKVNLALNGRIQWDGRPGTRFERVRVAADMNALERAFDATKYGEIAAVPCLDVAVSTVGAPALAPPGHEVVSVLVHFAPYDRRGGWDDAARERLSETVLEILSQHAPSIREHVVGVQVQTPVDLEARYGLTGGHLFHGEHALDQLLSLRPSASCAGHKTPLPGLFLCGAGTHPGGGISGMCGKLAAEAVLNAT